MDFLDVVDVSGGLGVVMVVLVETARSGESVFTDKTLVFSEAEINFCRPPTLKEMVGLRWSKTVRNWKPRLK